MSTCWKCGGPINEADPDDGNMYPTNPPKYAHKVCPEVSLCAHGNYEITACRTEESTPLAYRLALKPDGAFVLQGAFRWTEGWSTRGVEWRDIPTVRL